MRSVSLVMSECSLSGRGQGHVRNFYIVDLENFATASRRYTGDVHMSVRSRFDYDTSKTMEATIDLFPLSDYHPTDNFIVGLMNVSPLTVVPSVWNYDVCGQYPGVVPHGGIVFQPCIAEMPPRRYLVIQIERANGVLNFCEVLVFARCKLISVSSYSSPVHEVKFLAPSITMWYILHLLPQHKGHSFTYLLM